MTTAEWSMVFIAVAAVLVMLAVFMEIRRERNECIMLCCMQATANAEAYKRMETVLRNILCDELALYSIEHRRSHHRRIRGEL